jgi:hypothetical protein
MQFHSSDALIEVIGGGDLTVRPTSDPTHFLVEGVEDLHRLATQLQFLAGNLDEACESGLDFASLVEQLQASAWNCRYLFPRRLIAAHAAARGLVNFDIDGVLGTAEQSALTAIDRLRSLPDDVPRTEFATVCAELSNAVHSAAELLDSTATRLTDADCVTHGVPDGQF